MEIDQSLPPCRLKAEQVHFGFETRMLFQHVDKVRKVPNLDNEFNSAKMPISIELHSEA